MEMLENKPQIEFNYMAVIGNSGTGKTTYVKTVLNALKWDSLFLVDPNRQYADYTVNENAQYISPSELKDALNLIGKKLLLTQKKGILVIEDLSFTLDRICESLQVPMSRAKHLINLLLENFRKYDVKVIVVMHDIDKDIIAKCDTKVFFQTPLNDYKVRQYSKLLNFDLLEVNGLAKFAYLLKNGGEIEKGIVEPLESHQAIERDKGFMVKELLAKCHSLPERILILRLHVGFTNPQIARELNVEVHTVETEVFRLRKRGIPIPDARRSFRMENLAF